MDTQLALCTFEQSERLKKAGFDWECHWYYRDNLPDKNTLLQCVNNITQDFNAAVHKISAPTVELALQFMREVKGIICCVTFSPFGWHYEYDNGEFITQSVEYKNYPAAASALLDELLNLIEEGEK